MSQKQLVYFVVGSMLSIFIIMSWKLLLRSDQVLKISEGGYSETVQSLDRK